MRAARNASASQTLSQAAEFGWWAASQAAASAVDAEDDLSPAGDGGEGGGALHGVADEAEVGGGIGGEIRGLHGRSVCWPLGAAEAVVAGFGHNEEQDSESGLDCQVLCDAKYVEIFVPAGIVGGVRGDGITIGCWVLWGG